MGKPSAPEPTPPTETSAASTATNVATAKANAWLGNIDEYTPEGSTTFDQTGEEEVYDPYTDETQIIPRFTRTTTYSPEQQAIYDEGNAAKLNLSQLANQQSGMLEEYLATPFSGANAETERRLIELGSQRLTPALAQRDETVRARLANQGIKAGSEAYNREMQNLGQNENDAWNQLILQGHGQAFSEAQAARNQPINEITALLSGSQVSQPNFAGANIRPIADTDNANIIANYDRNRLDAWQAEQAQRSSLFGGLMGLGGSLLSLSDERTKKNVKKVGKLDGHNLYEYEYKADPEGGRHVGVMAQEVQKKRPDAVEKGEDGLHRVDYGKLFEKVG